MILKASQRGSGRDLAVHLMRVDDNEHVHLHKVRGFASEDLRGAFKEAEAISLGTKCRQYLFSLSLSPPERETVPVEVFERAVDEVEAQLGLSGQPRAIVFHEKEGRRHAHCVWSRIDPETMTARNLPFFKRKLMGISRELYLDHGWQMPRGLENPAERDPTNFTLAEWQQAKRHGVDPRWLKQAVQVCWTRSDGIRAFQHSLEERGFFLARGDRRGFVVVDHNGEVYSLPRMLDLKTKEVRARLGDGGDLPSVEATQRLIGERIAPAIKRHIAESRTQFRKRSAALDESKVEMTNRHRGQRAELDRRLRADWDDEVRTRAKRLPTGLRAIWARVTGRYRRTQAELEAEADRSRVRQQAERQSLIDRLLAERRKLQDLMNELRHRQAEELSELRREMGHHLRLARTPSPDKRLADGLESEPRRRRFRREM